MHKTPQGKAYGVLGVLDCFVVARNDNVWSNKIKNNKMKKLKAGILVSLPLDDLEYIHFILCLYILPTICCCYRGIFSQRFFLLRYTLLHHNHSCTQLF